MIGFIQQNIQNVLCHPGNTEYPSSLIRIFAVHMHTCHIFLTEICEMRQFFKGDLVKFSEIFTKITLERPQNSKKKN